MSTQRRRVLEDGGLIIPADGVYIEGLDGRAYTADNWNGGNDANSVIVASGDVKFRMALTEPFYRKYIGDNNYEPFDKYMTAISDYTAAKADYNGSGNTANMLKVNPRTDLAAGWCNAFTFPDGKTKGYLPSLGQLNIAYQNKAAVNAALTACGGKAMETLDYRYWSSTFREASDRGYIYFWTLYWMDGTISYNQSTTYGAQYVRPFANLL